VSRRAILLALGGGAAVVGGLIAVVVIQQTLDQRRVERRVKQRLQAAIPVGTPVWQAHAVLDRIRPHVNRRFNASFGDRTQLDYLYLMWNEPGDLLHRVEAAVVHKDGAVTELLVEIDSSNDPR
jgi:hypothetical protein